VLMALAVFFLSPAPDLKPSHGRPLREMLRPLRHTRVWRFGLYYVVVFGAYVALSGWLPKFYMDTYGVSLSTAAMLTASFIFPASLLRPAGGYLSDRLGPRVITYSVFLVMTAALIALSVPSRMNVASFTALIFVLGCAMGIGKASVFKYIPDYFPEDVGAAGGVVGTLGALGGFVLPPAFGMLARWTGIPQLAFAALLGLTLWSLCWLHVTVVRARSAQETSREFGAVLLEPRIPK
jgi:NNP family nitrate/nitrite transporter-like MFS transporter